MIVRRSEDSDSQPQHAIQNRCCAAAASTTSGCTMSWFQTLGLWLLIEAEQLLRRVASAMTSSSQPEVGSIGRGDALRAYGVGGCKHGQQFNATSAFSIAGYESADLIQTGYTTKSMAELLSRAGEPPRGLCWC